MRPLKLLQDPKDDRDYIFKTAPISLTDGIDYTEQMSPIKDQGNYGSCVGFAVTAMKEWQEQKEQNEEVLAGKDYVRSESSYDLSEAWVYWSSKRIDPWPNEEGTSIRYAMKVLNKIGVPCEKAWPYSDTVVGEPSSWAHLVARWAVINSYYRIQGVAQLKNALAVVGPTVCGIECFQEIFKVTSNGVVAMPKNPSYSYGGHAICMVGYDDSKQLFKFKNSWGAAWGQKGYGYLPYMYIEKYMMDAWVATDISVTKEMLKGSVSL